jgi:hypothetical protein
MTRSAGRSRADKTCTVVVTTSAAAPQSPDRRYSTLTAFYLTLAQTDLTGFIVARVGHGVEESKIVSHLSLECLIQNGLRSILEVERRGQFLPTRRLGLDTPRKNHCGATRPPLPQRVDLRHHVIASLREAISSNRGLPRRYKRSPTPAIAAGVGMTS